MKNYVQIGNNRANTKNTVGVKNRTLSKSTLDGKQSLERFIHDCNVFQSEREYVLLRVYIRSIVHIARKWVLYPKYKRNSCVTWRSVVW